MKTINIRKKIAIVFMAIAVAICGAAGVSLFNASASGVVVGGLNPYMIKGAFVRVPDEDCPKGGLRFTMALSAEEYTAFTENVGEEKPVKSVSFGIFIAPGYYHEKFALNAEENVNGSTAKYGWLTAEEKSAGISYADSAAGKAGLYQIINTESSAMSAGKDGENDVYVFNGSVVNMFTENMLTEYTCAGYVRYTDADGTHYIFADNNDNLRSMTYVAQLAAENGEDASGVLGDTYIEPFKTEKTTYTVNYFIKNSDGKYVKDEMKSGSVESTVGASVTIDEEIEGYSVVAREESKAAGIVYANGKSVFNVYYRDKSVLFDGTEKDFDFCGNQPGEENVSLADSPLIEGDKSVLMEDTGTASTAYLQLPDRIKKTQIANIALDEFAYITFRIYTEASGAISFFPYNANGSISVGLSANVWKNYTFSLLEIKDNATDEWLRFWSGTTGYKVYISEIYLSGFDATIADFDEHNASPIISLSDATANGATTSIVSDPTDSGRGTVYKWQAGSSAGSYNSSASWVNIKKHIDIAKSLGYCYLAVDIYASNANHSIQINGWNFSTEKAGEWVTKKVSLDSATSGNLMWMQAGGDYILFDNFRFTKFATVLDFESEETSEILFSSTHSGKPSISIIEDESAGSSRGKAFAYKYTGSIHDTTVSPGGLAGLINAAKALGFTQMSIDVIYTSGDASIELFGIDLKPSKSNVWETKTLNLSDIDTTKNDNVFWLSEAGAIMFDNVTFIK